MTKKTLPEAIKKAVVDLYKKGDTYLAIMEYINNKFVKTLHDDYKTLTVNSTDIVNIRNEYKLVSRLPDGKPKRHLFVSRKHKITPDAEIELLVQNLITRLRHFDNPPLAILVEPKSGTYRIQTSVEYEGKI